MSINYLSSYFVALEQQIRSLDYVSLVECSFSDEHIGHACLIVDTKEVLTLSMVAEIFDAVQQFVGDQNYPQIELGPKTLVLADLVYTRMAVDTYGPLVGCI